MQTQTTPDTPTPRQRQRQQTRQQILAAAIDSFARSGFDAASLAEIAARAGVKKALVQYHFSTKDQLWKEAALLLWQQRNDSLAMTITAPGDTHPLQTMRRGFVALIEFSVAKPQWLWFMFHEAAAGGERQAWLLENCMDTDYKMGKAFVKEYQQQGLIRQGDPLHLLHIISGALTYNVLVAPMTLRATGLNLASEQAIEEQVSLLQNLLRP
ncbi:MAG: TetR/AcrR family transcriptional regulator [Halioglobus sp.]